MTKTINMKISKNFTYVFAISASVPCAIKCLLFRVKVPIQAISVTAFTKLGEEVTFGHLGKVILVEEFAVISFFTQITSCKKRNKRISRSVFKWKKEEYKVREIKQEEDSTLTSACKPQFFRIVDDDMGSHVL